MVLWPVPTPRPDHSATFRLQLGRGSRGHRRQTIWCGAYAPSPMAALADADILLIVTEWKEFRSPDFEKIKSRLKTPVIFDGRNLYEPAMVKSMGLDYEAIGRGVAPGAGPAAA